MAQAVSAGTGAHAEGREAPGLRLRDCATLEIRSGKESSSSGHRWKMKNFRQAKLMRTLGRTKPAKAAHVGHPALRMSQSWMMLPPMAPGALTRVKRRNSRMGWWRPEVKTQRVLSQ